MATWKEKGVVPDSDDEDDLDSQSIASQEAQSNERRVNELHGLESFTKFERDGETNATGEEEKGDTRASTTEIQPPYDLLPPNNATKTEGSPKSHIDHIGFLPSSPNSPRAFKIHQLFWDALEGTPEAQSADESRTNDPISNELQAEEISKSYVRITSPTSNILLSLSDSQPDVLPDHQSKSHERSNSDPRRSKDVSSRGVTVDNVSSKIYEEQTNFTRRSLRQRNPIQLHPYIVEQEKYRRTLKNSGIAPMRIAQSQDDKRPRSRGTTSPSPESQELHSNNGDSQDVDFEAEESQQMDFVWDPLPSSSAVQSVEDKDRNEATDDDSMVRDDDDDDDEFPDIHELLQRRQMAIEPKRRKKTYSTKSKRPLLSKFQTQPNASLNRAESGRVFDIPASPPATSSPFPTASRLRNSLSRAASTSSKEPTSSLFDWDEVDVQAKADFPTPATSAVKLASEDLLLDFDSDSEDPFASDPEKAPSESSSDESIQIRKVGKKIRGVLPASHLRLDQQRKKQRAPSHPHRESMSASPAKATFRRGVALPKIPRDTRSPSAPTSTRIPFLDDDSEDSEEENNANSLIMEHDARSELESMFTQSRMGFAEEDDRIDAMLPSRKRRSTGSNNSRKKRRARVTSSSHDLGEPYRRQPKITEHLNRPQQSTSLSEHSRRPGYSGRTPGTGHTRAPPRPRVPAPPSLSVLDVAGSPSGKPLPQFMRIACRTAKSKYGQGRQSPTKKFIRLATREDTVDAQVVLQDWREGRIQPRNLGHQLRSKSIATQRVPLQQMEDNQQIRLPSPVKKVKLLAQSAHMGHATLARKLVISKGQRKSVNEFVTRGQAPPQPLPQPPKKNAITPRFQERPGCRATVGHPAQLEATELEHSHRYPVSAFRSTKKVLDTLYRATRKRPAPQANLQLSRFLADDDDVLPSIETAGLAENSLGVAPKVLEAAQVQSIPRRKKRLPRHVDAGAAMYRQPSNPLILDFLTPLNANNSTETNKLLGLGKFGTNYPQNFDIFPLRSGVFFHESTFIGCGRLSDMLKDTACVSPGVVRPAISLKVGKQEFSWGPWNENVSSEVGVCFDWLLENLFAQAQNTSSPQSTDPVVVVTRIVEYVQQHLSFTGPTTLNDFLLRMSVVFQEFSSGLNAKEKAADKAVPFRAIEVLEICALLVLQLLQMSRARPEQLAVTFELEDLLKNVTGNCIAHLLSHGLEGLHKLYDDLQYLSFRENGIQRDQHVVSGWVIIIKVLDAARISRGSFWDVTNSKLIDVDVRKSIDAREMEKLWFSMFSLLPLCEFDEFGVVIPGQRQRAAFDNWNLPQQLLKRVFALYGSNPRQFPSFNDYCRAIVSRCHYLMVEWGWWKCSGIIGTLFDFFASQNLAHLRNEEVHASPRFLQELHEQPSLAVEPEDRCFHIFLKITALGIKYLRQVDDTKGIRNLVARLLPNHDRQYPKEEAIHQRELASLRNHHDLLCTLYWSAPPQQRPSPLLIQELVVPERSHKEACLINARAWECLARFVVTNFTNAETYQPFATWQNTFFSKLLQQYLDSESDVRQQADSLKSNGRELVTEISLQEVIASNKRSTMEALHAPLRAIVSVLKVARSPGGLMCAFARKTLLQALDISVHNDVNLSQQLLDHFSLIVRSYINQINSLRPLDSSISVQNAGNTEGDSQDSDGLGSDMVDRWEMTMTLSEVLPSFSVLLRNVLEHRIGGPSAVTLEHLVEDWAHLTSLSTEVGIFKLREFLVDGSNAIFHNRLEFEKSAKYWPLFLGKLVQENDLAAFNMSGFDLGRQWLILLTRPKPDQKYENQLTAALQRKGFKLCVGTFDDNTHELSGLGNLTSIPAMAIHRIPNQKLIANAINNMRDILQEQRTTNCPSSATAFSKTLERMMDSLQRHLKQMSCNSDAHIDYVHFVQQVVTAIRAYGSDIVTLPAFFVQTSQHYWPHVDDPNLFAAGIVSYSLGLSAEHSGKTSSELFYYLFNGFKHGLINAQMKQHVSHIKKAMKNWHFTKFMLLEFLPAALEVGFTAKGGWVLCSRYLPVASNHIIALLSEPDGNVASCVFEYTTNLLRLIVGRLTSAYLAFTDNGHGILFQHDPILAVTCQFWLAVSSELSIYSKKVHGEALAIDKLSAAVERFMYKVTRQDDTPLDGRDTGAFQFEKGLFFDRFFKALKGDIDDNWKVDDYDEWVAIKGVGGRGYKKAIVSHRPLIEVIKSDLRFFLESEDGPDEIISVPLRSTGDMLNHSARFLRNMFDY